LVEGGVRGRLVELELDEKEWDKEGSGEGKLRDINGLDLFKVV
jgi:hypothetical protein